MNTPPRKKQGSDLQPVFIGDFASRVFGKQRGRQHKKAGHGFCTKSHAAKVANQVEEPEAGRMIQTQVINLVIGVVSCPSRITHAASDRVGACGAKLHERVQQNTSGRAGLELPFRFALNPPERPERGKRERFFCARVGR